MSIASHIKQSIDQQKQEFNSLIYNLNQLFDTGIINFTEPVDEQGTSLGQHVIHNLFANKELFNVLYQNNADFNLTSSLALKGRDS